MEKLKQYLWERMIDELEKSSNEKIKDNLKAFKTKDELIQFVKFYSYFGFDDMKRVASLEYWIRNKKYHKTKGRLLGNKTKAMPDDIYQKLINYVGENIGLKQKLALEFEGIEGARGEDTVRIKIKDLDFEKHSVEILNRKRLRWYEVPLNKKLEFELQQFIKDNYEQIKAHHDYVFFSNNKFQIRNHLSQKYLKTLVYNVLKILRLNKVYTKSSDGRNLYLYSLHSLRGHAGTRIDNRTGHDRRKVQEFLDHQPGSTSTDFYLERNNEKDLKGVV